MYFNQKNIKGINFTKFIKKVSTQKYKIQRKNIKENPIRVNKKETNK